MNGINPYLYIARPRLVKTMNDVYTATAVEDYIMQENTPYKSICKCGSECSNSSCRTKSQVENEVSEVVDEVLDLDLEWGVDISDGLTADYYKLPEGATELKHLIWFKNMNAQVGEIFRSAYRLNDCPHSDVIRNLNKIVAYAEQELERLKKYEY